MYCNTARQCLFPPRSLIYFFLFQGAGRPRNTRYAALFADGPSSRSRTASSALYTRRLAGCTWEYRLSRTRKLKLAVGLASAVLQVHQNLVLHLDVKPQNFVICFEDCEASEESEKVTIRLVDFGLSVAFKQSPNGQEDSEQLSTGTPGYESPEMEEWGETSVKSDVYSLGRTLTELWSGSLFGAPDDAAHSAASEECNKFADSRMVNALATLHWKNEAALDIKHLLVHDRQVGLLLARCLAEQPEHRPLPATVLQTLQKLLQTQLGEDHAKSSPASSLCNQLCKC